MRRQLYRGGGITNLYPRQKYGIGSWVKERVRKLIPNELADVAVKAAPFVAPFNPGIAGLMRGIGRFDQRGSLSDALKQGLATTALGAGARYLGGQRGMGDIMGGGLRDGLTNPISADSPLRDIFKAREFDPNKPKMLGDTGGSMDKMSGSLGGDGKRGGLGIVQKATDATIGKIPLVKELPDMVKQKLFVGGVFGGADYLINYLKGNFRPQNVEQGESMEDYLAARKDAVGKQMRIYMDNYFKFDPEYSQLDDAGRNAFVARYNVAQGGRIGYQTGGISMANTLAQNRAINEAQRQAVGGMFEAARSKLPGYRTPVQEYAMSDDSILGPLSKQAASTIIEGQDKSQAALDMLNQTSMSPTGTRDTGTGDTGTGDTGIMTQAPTTRPTMADVAGPSTSNNLLSLFERYKDIQTPIPADPESGFVGETALGNIEKGVKGFLTSDRGLKYGKDIPLDINDIYPFIEARRRSFSPDLSGNYQGGDVYHLSLIHI